MKKRAVAPDSYTYTHLLGGIASQPNPSAELVAEALKVYEHLKTKNTKVQLTTKHTNCLLNVCIKANDLGKAWQILASLPSAGPNAPDAATYTVFMRGLRGQGDEALEDGKRAWAGALGRANRGTLAVDEFLANAYLDLLAHGPSADSWWQVFVVAHQVFNLSLPPNVPQHRPDTTFFGRYLTPDDYTLGILLKAAENLKDFSLAERYWSCLNRVFMPTEVSLQRFLRCASTSRAGTAAVDALLGTSQKTQLTEWNYTIALRACIHSGGHHESYANALKVLSLAREDGKAGLAVVREFLLVALTSMDSGTIKRALGQTVPHISPAAFDYWRASARNLPRDHMEVARDLLKALRKAVTWNGIVWGQHEYSQWLARLRDARATLASWDGAVVGQELVQEVAEDAPPPSPPPPSPRSNLPSRMRRPFSAPLVSRLPYSAAEAKVPMAREVRDDKLPKVVAGLKRFSPMQRKSFIDSLYKYV